MNQIDKASQNLKEYDESYTFKEKYSIGKIYHPNNTPCLEKRTNWAQTARKEYPSKLPLIVERAADVKGMDALQNPK